MLDVLAALIPPGVMAGVVIAFVVWLLRSQMGKKDEPEEPEDDAAGVVRDDTME